MLGEFERGSGASGEFASGSGDYSQDDGSRRQLSSDADVSSGSGDSSSGSGDFPDPEGSGIPFVVVPAHMVRNANTGGRADPHDAIICTVPLDARLPEVARELHVSVSLNGQQYTSRSEYPLWWQPSTAILHLYGPMEAQSISPSSGPAAGETNVTISGTNFSFGSNYTCRFDKQKMSLPGTFLNDSAILCRSPRIELKPCFSQSVACDPHQNRTAYLDIAANGENDIPRRQRVVPFVQFRPPVLTAISPSSGPSVGGTLVVLSGMAPTLSGGSDYRCRFVSRMPFASDGAASGASDFSPGSGDSVFGSGAIQDLISVAATVSATFDGDNGVVRCTTPSLPSITTAAYAAFSVSLNGQQYHTETDQAGQQLSFNFLGHPRVLSISPTCGPTLGATNLTLVGTDLRGGTDYRCRFAVSSDLVNASTRAYYHPTSGDVSCLSPPGLHEVGLLHVELSLNGQESTADGALLVRYKPPRIDSLSPASGPIAGSTSVRVEGNHSFAAAHGCDVKCKFASATNGALVNGTLPPSHETGRVDCTTPQGVSSGALEISLNAQQYTESKRVFASYPSPTMERILPPLGPISGDTKLLIPTTNLHNVGTDLRCRFTLSQDAGDDAVVDTLAQYLVPGETDLTTPCWSEAGSTMLLQCNTPPQYIAGRFNRLGRHEVQVTLNGQQFSTPLGFEVLPSPRVDSIYPLSTPELGGITITVHGQGFGAFNLTAAGRISNAADDVASGFEATSGDITSSEDGTGEAVSGEAIIENATSLTSTYAQGLLSCRIGEATVPATLLNQSAVTCRTPSGVQSGVSAELQLHFETGDPSKIEDHVQIYGDAIVGQHVLRLTNALPNQRGSLHFAPPTLLGSSPVQKGGPFPLSFRLSFDLTIGTGIVMEEPVHERPSGDGFAISIGDLPAGAAGELGSGDGLRVCLRTRANMISVSYGTRLLLSVPMVNPERLRSNESFPFVLTLRQRALSLSIAGALVLTNAALPEWEEDAQPSWRFGLSARTNGVRGENHWVQRLRLQLSPSLDTASTPVEVTSNGQQYSSSGLELAYFGGASPQSLTPSLGPAHGSTGVVVRGESLRGGSAYRCRFGTHVEMAQFNATDETVRCVAPSLEVALGSLGLSSNTSSGTSESNVIHEAAVVVPLAISLNEQDYVSLADYTYYTHPRVLTISPQAGPVKGFTEVTLFIDGLAKVNRSLPNASVPECKFGTTPPVPAVLGAEISGSVQETSSGEADASSGSGEPSIAVVRSIKCVSPAATARFEPLYISLNQQDYRLDGASNFTFHEEPQPVEVVPAGGPRHGGTLVHIAGSRLTPQHVDFVSAQCRFGMKNVSAMVNRVTNDISCTSPSALDAGGEAMVALSGDGDDDATPDYSGISPKSGTLRCVNADCLLSGVAKRIGGVIRLTNGPIREAGQLTITPHVTGWQRALHTWDVAFGVFIIGDGGMTLSVGDVPDSGLGTLGGGAVLRVLLTAGLSKGSVSWQGSTLHTSALPPISGGSRGVAHVAVDETGRTTVEGGAWRHVRIALLEDGLRVTVDGLSVISSLQIPRWSPQPGWRLALSSSTTNLFGLHWIRRLTVRTDASLRQTAVPLTVSLNGQQFAPAILAFAYHAHPAVASVEPRSGPADGGTRVLVQGFSFVDGASQHRCRFGSADPVEATYHNESGYLACTSPPVSWASNASNDFAIELHRHGQMQVSDTADRSTFDVYSSDATSSLHFTSLTGPMGGGTALHFVPLPIGGDESGINMGSAYRCRFDLRHLRVPERETELMELADAALLNSATGFNSSRDVRPSLTLEASRVPGGGLTCISPQVRLTHAHMIAGAGAAMPISISLNGQQYEGQPQSLGLFEPPHLDFASPACGPVSGGTTLTIVGSQLGGGSDYRCRIGGIDDDRKPPEGSSLIAHDHSYDVSAVSTTRANYSQTLHGEVITCTTPRAPALDSDVVGRSRWKARLAIALNAQQYTPLENARLPPGTAPGFRVLPIPHRGFHLYSDELDVNLVEPNVTRGGELVFIYGGRLDGACAYMCRFGSDVAAGSYEANVGGIRCHAPHRSPGVKEPIWLSLNGQQFSPSGLNLTWM